MGVGESEKISWDFYSMLQGNLRSSLFCNVDVQLGHC